MYGYAGSGWRGIGAYGRQAVLVGLSCAHLALAQMLANQPMCRVYCIVPACAIDDGRCANLWDSDL